MVIYNGDTVFEKLLSMPHNKIFQADRAASANRENSSGKSAHESFRCTYNLQILVIKRAKYRLSNFPDAQVDLNFSLWLTSH